MVSLKSYLRSKRVQEIGLNWRHWRPGAFQNEQNKKVRLEDFLCFLPKTTMFCCSLPAAELSDGCGVHWAPACHVIYKRFELKNSAIAAAPCRELGTRGQSFLTLPTCKTGCDTKWRNGMTTGLQWAQVHLADFFCLGSVMIQCPDFTEMKVRPGTKKNSLHCCLLHAAELSEFLLRIWHNNDITSYTGVQSSKFRLCGSTCRKHGRPGGQAFPALLFIQQNACKTGCEKGKRKKSVYQCQKCSKCRCLR